MEEATADHENGTAVIIMAPNADLEAMKQAVQKGGYAVLGIE